MENSTSENQPILLSLIALTCIPIHFIKGSDIHNIINKFNKRKTKPTDDLGFYRI